MSPTQEIEPVLASFCCDMLLGGQTDWIVRRKETVDVVNETSLKHLVSLDFSTSELPRIVRPADGAPDILKVPFTLLRKEPGRFTRFDFTDEGGRSLPLSSRAANSALSAFVLAEAASRTLAKNGATLTAGLRGELFLVAQGEKDLALAIVQAAYLEPSGAIATDADAPHRAQLVNDADFRWLLRTLAYSSILVVDLDDNHAARRVLKLKYEERITDVTRVRKGRVLATIGALGYRLGWRGYVAQFLSPFVGAQTYHFELHAPTGMQLLEAGMSGQPCVYDDWHRVHLYESDATRKRTTVVYAQFRIRGQGFVGSAFFTAAVIAGSMFVAKTRAPELSDTATSAPSLLLLFPGLVATYFARPAHPLVARLLDLARWTLILTAGVAYIAAGRLALISGSHPANPSNLKDLFWWLFVTAGACAIVLLGTYRLPLRLSSWPRRALRKVFRRRGPADPPDA